MSTVTIDIRSLDESLADAARAMDTLAPSVPRISFETPELLWKTLTDKRWAILKAMAGAGRLSLREIARRVGRDVKGVHADVHVLLHAGLIDRDTRGFLFPYDAIHVDFVLRAA